MMSPNYHNPKCDTSYHIALETKEKYRDYNHMDKPWVIDEAEKRESVVRAQELQQMLRFISWNNDSSPSYSLRLQ